MDKSSTTTATHEESNNWHDNSKETSTSDEESVKVLSVDKITVEKIVLERPGSREVLFKKTDSKKKLSESIRRLSTRTRQDKWTRRDKRGPNDVDFHGLKRKIYGSLEKLNDTSRIHSKVPLGTIEKVASIGILTAERKIIPIKYKSASIPSLIKSDRLVKNSNACCKVPPSVPPKPVKKHEAVIQQELNTTDDVQETKKKGEINDDRLSLITAHARLETSQSEIERLQKNLVQIDSSTAEAYKQKLPILYTQVLKASPHVDLSENVNKPTFDEDFLAKHNYSKTLKIEEKVLLETDFDCVPEVPAVVEKKSEKSKWSKEVSEVEKRWSGDFLNNRLDQNSSESSKSSYIEEIGSTSSHESIVEDVQRRTSSLKSPLSFDRDKKHSKTSGEETVDDTVSTVDTNSCFEDRIRAVDEDIKKKLEEEGHSNESKESTLKESSSIKSCRDEEVIDTNTNEIQNEIKQERIDTESIETQLFNEKRQQVAITEQEIKIISTADGYAKLIKEITMEPSGSSKGKEEKKKKSGLRRLLPGLFSPKDSRKDYKKEQKEKKKRDERHFSQHQQNGVYTKSPDTMNLNEDIKRNVNLDASLNSSMIEERLNEIKQELFPDQGMTTSTPDHFLQDETYQERRTPRLYTANSSLSSIAIDDKWMDQNIISGSPDMRKIKQQVASEPRKCNLERKHSLQEAQPRFLRNHGPSGRISAPPSERYLLRPRAVHPIDRPLPAIPQKVEFSNYQHQQEIGKHEPYRQNPVSNYQANVYYSGNQNYTNEMELYANTKTEVKRNQSIDSGFTLTPVSNQVKTNRQFLVAQNGQKLGINVTKSPKYSPSSSQKSGDYADSSYTPNSSQKSEFSPGSSKSGEYYLSSPRDSCTMSPDTSFNKDQVDHEKPMMTYQIPPSSVKIAPADDHLYDEAPRSLSVSPRQPHHNAAQEATFLRGSPNIPLSTNLAKLRAHVEAPRTSENKTPSVSNHASNLTIMQSDKSVVQSTAEQQQVTSPLTILTLDNNVSIAGGSRSRSGTPLSPVVLSPPRMLIQTRSPERTNTSISSPTASSIKSVQSMSMSTFQPRKAQPNDQILIASPKREAIYDERSSNRTHPRSPSSPVPMADSPSQVLPGRQNLRQMLPSKLEKSIASQGSQMDHHPPPQGFQDEPQGPTSPKIIQRPEPIYMRKPAHEGRADMLLIQTTPATSSVQIGVAKSEGHQLPSAIQSDGKPVSSPRPMSPQARRDASISPERQESLQLRKRNPSPAQERPQPIYDDRHTSSEQIYGRRAQQSPVPIQANQMHIGRPNQPIYASKHEALNQEPVYGRQGMTREQIYAQRNVQEKQGAVYYGWRTSEPIYAQQANKQLSPSKRQTLQHLEAFYWQQKALECQRVSENSPTVSHRPQELKSDQPEVREAIYWQQLKKLNDEQQRKIFERNQFEEHNDMMKKRCQIPLATLSNTGQDQQESIYSSQNKVVTKPPVPGQKVQHQPIQIVRPQQAVRDISDVKNQTSTSSSPHFVCNDEQRRKLPSETDDGGFNESNKINAIEHKSSSQQICEDNEDRKTNPPPIFKRGSLISNSSSSVEYGTMGTKRVSFSNQSNAPEIGSGNWPTKHGMAPEPPTRRHRVEEKIPGDYNNADSNDFLQEENQNNVNSNAANAIYGNISPNLRHHIIHETEYDAKPLPPLPPSKEVMMNRSNSMRDNRHQRMEVQRAKVLANPRRCLGVSESESGSEAGEIQRILHRRNEEEWNPSSKGRQANDTGGSGRAEGEGGSNDLPGGRRSGGIGVLANVGVGRSSGTGGGGGRSRDEPRRHTLSGDHAPSLHHQPFNVQPLHPLHPHHLPTPHGQYGTPPRHGTMDLEMGTKSRQRKSPFPRGYPPPSTAMLFDDDPGIMSEVETSSTGFRRGGKQRSSLPVVRTPSKTLERPLGLVFLQYRKETKRALLPNEITSIDTVKALFVRSFPKQLTMEYLDSPDVKVYIHDSNKDMFYELEDHRSHLRDIRDRSVLRLIEKSDIVGIPPMQGVPVGGQGLPPHWEDQSYFSEPEFDSEFQHQHIHKSKATKNSTSGNYYMGGSSTLPRGGPIMRAYSPAAPAVLAGPNATPTQPKTLGTPGGGGGGGGGGVAPAKPLRGYQCGKTPLGSLGGSARFSRDSSVSLYSIPDRLHGESGYMSSPERGGGVGAGIGRYPTYSTQSSYEEPYYSQYSGTVTPVIDEEASDTELLEESYSLYGVKPPGRPPSAPPRSPFPPGAPALPPGQTYDVTRIRVEHMERQLANLTGLVQKALTHAPHPSPSPRDYLQVPAGRDPYARNAGAGDEFDKHSSSSSASLPDDTYLRTDVKPPKLGKDKSVSFEKSVSFSDEPPDMNSPKQHSPQHAADTKPTKPAIKSSTLPRMSSQERDRHKPNLPPKPVALAAGGYVYRDLALTPEMYNQLRGLQKKAKDLRQEVRNLRRMSQAQAHTVRETIRDTFITIRAMLLSGGDAAWAAGDSEKIRLSREEDLYKQEMLRLEKDLTELESTVEELRGNVINRKTRVNMSDVENMALILSKSSKTVADLKVRFPSLQEGMKGLLSSEMEKVVREEKFLKEEPERLESALRRCKKLTGTLVTLKRLASVQEQRLPNAVSLDSEETPPITPTSAQHSKTTAPVPAERTLMGSTSLVGGGSHPGEPSAAHQQRPENALDALLDELQTFSRPSSQLSQVSSASQSTNHMPNMLEIGRSSSQIVQSAVRPPNMSEIGRKGSIDSSSSLAIIPPGTTLRRLHSYPSSSDTDTSPPIARIQVSDGAAAGPPPAPPQKPPVPERNAELLQLVSARRVPPPPPPRTSSKSPLASPTSPQLPPRNPSTGTLRRNRSNAKETGKPPMALPPAITGETGETSQTHQNNILSTSNSSSCESINSQEGLQNKKGRQEQLEQRHQELLRKQKALQEQYARLQQLQRNTSGLATVPPTPPDLLKKTGSESNLLAKMGLSMSAANSGSLTSLASAKNNNNEQSTATTTMITTTMTTTTTSTTTTTTTTNDNQGAMTSGNATTGQTTTSKIYETDIL